MVNADVRMTLDQAVDEVLSLLTGLDLDYSPAADRYHVVVRMLNKALRQVALENEWSYYADTMEVATAVAGQQTVELPSRVRMRIIDDDSVRLVNDVGRPVRWAYILPRDAIHKYQGRYMLYCSITRSTLMFSRPFLASEAGLRIMVPVMREPKMFPQTVMGEEIDPDVLNMPVDFDYPDLVVTRAAYLYSQTDPLFQPRVQTLEAQYKDIMYQLIERDTRHTESPDLNDFQVPIETSIHWSNRQLDHDHPHSMDRW